ncbi:MAG: hypothetical protein R6T78_04645, partial [Dehalococcoidales bacterium]
MVKVRLVTLKDYSEKTLKTLHQTGVLHVEESRELEPVDRAAIENQRKETSELATLVNHMLAYLTKQEEVTPEEDVDVIYTRPFSEISREVRSIQIYLNESEGVKDRGKYYDDTGVIKDMFQNHILQVLSLIAMEEPENLSAEEISEKKVEVFKEMADNDLSDIDKHIVRGQYDSNTVNGEKIEAYREEDEIDPNSKTATFMALKLFLNNERWRNVPIYLKSG